MFKVDKSGGGREHVLLRVEETSTRHPTDWIANH